MGSNDAFLLGDIDGLRNAEITETGFVLSPLISDDERLRLNQAEVLSILSPSTQDSSISQDQAFAARIAVLQPRTKYYFRAYASLSGDQTAYGAIDTFSTSQLIVSAATISRDNPDCAGSAKISVNISGASTSGDNSFGVVWSSDDMDFFPTLSSSTSIPAPSLDVTGNMQIDFRVDCNTTYFVRGFIKTASDEVYGPVKAFTMIPGGKWIRVDDFPEDFNRAKCTYSFSASNYGFVLASNRVQSQSNLWMFDPSDLSWQMAAKPPLFPTTACSRKISSENSILYFGEGLDLWQYILRNDEWIKVLTPSSETGNNIFHDNNFMFQYQTDYYWGTGSTGNSIESKAVHGTVWRQSGSSEFGEQLPDFPGKSRQLTSYFILDKKGYVGLGQDEKDQFFTDFWALDFGAKSWVPVREFPDKISSSVSFTMNDKAYILTGFDVDGKPLPNFYEYDPKLGEWNRLSDFGRSDGNADIGFSADGVIFGGLGISNSGEARREIWRYVPELE